MKPGDVCRWLDQGPVILLERVVIYDPVSIHDLGESFYKKDWPSEMGWTVKVLATGEIIDVHDNTLRKYK